MINPLTRYKTYHKNKINIFIHQLCIPLLLATAYAVIPIELCVCINLYYSISYILFDIASKKSINSIYYLQTIFLGHFILRKYLSIHSNATIHIVSWMLQILGHKIFEKNTPALIDNLYDSFLFAPYFTFLETFYPNIFYNIKKEKYTIINNNYVTTKKTIIYFAGLFQKAHIEFKEYADEMTDYNHIYMHI